jgi:glycine cleavage system H protein
MECPFIRQTRVHSCSGAGFRKPIPELHHAANGSRCLTAAFGECEYCTPEAASAGGPPCPLLEESLVQYCAAAPVMKFIPYSEPLLSRCGSGAHRYCGLYLDVVRAAQAADDGGADFAAPDHLHYTSNHWWMDTSGDGPCHLGIDAFLARMLGPVERVGFATPHGVGRPTVIVTVNGVHFTATFPGLVEVLSSNLHLRLDPSRVSAEPYSAGWIFEGRVSESQRNALRASLLDAKQAREHMAADNHRLSERLQARHTVEGVPLAADGGVFSPGVLAELDRDEALGVFHEFCSPLAS